MLIDVLPIPLNSLQTFLLDGNFLQSLPAELEKMHQLSYLGLSFNEFIDIPVVLEKLPAMDKLCMSGNCMETLNLQTLRRMPHIKHVDLRLNVIRRLVADEANFLHHVTQLDLRDNKLGELDATIFNNAEILHCERNQLVTLKISGYLLKALYASSNELVHLDVYPIPNYLTYMDVSRNHLESLPEWVCDSRKLEVLDLGHNQIRELPARLFCNVSLRKLLAGHNQLARLPERIERTHVEVLDVQHNLLTELPSNLLLKTDSLRYLNASANKLEMLPPATLSEETCSILQELYLTNNQLTDKCVPLLTGHPRLKILHMAYNRLQSFPASKMAKLEELEEIDVSGNKLKSIPTTIMNCRRMHTVIAHSNCIEVFPEVMQLGEIKCVDLSCNELTEVTLPENLPPKLQELDLTGNPRLVLDHKTLELLNNIRCFKIDQPSAGDASGAPAVWSHGYTEASGVKNKLCVAALSANNFCENREALYGVFDGDRNVEVPYLLQCTMSDILAEELQKTKSEEEYMINTFIVMQSSGSVESVGFLVFLVTFPSLLLGMDLNCSSPLAMLKGFCLWPSLAQPLLSFENSAMHTLLPGPCVTEILCAHADMRDPSPLSLSHTHTHTPAKETAKLEYSQNTLDFLQFFSYFVLGKFLHLY
ncbi:PH domain leucine-rich repeat-containing protein phosphatase 1 [Varanus komodoensis]|nr:PH domain leucine-rich repeat-containing protein phosphatase 1 [Varanus komodoensis]